MPQRRKSRVRLRCSSLATGASASAAEYLLELDGFNAIMVVDMLTKRYHNYVQPVPEAWGRCRTP